MKKDPTRDYVTEAFRFYAASGRPTYMQARERVYRSGLLERTGDPPETANMYAQSMVERHTPALLDIFAVNKTLEMLDKGGKRAIIEVIEIVYLEEANKPIRKKDISDRVRYASLSIPADERTIYRWLKEARLLCAAVRGMRIGKENIPQ